MVVRECESQKGKKIAGSVANLKDLVGVLLICHSSILKPGKISNTIPGGKQSDEQGRGSFEQD